METAPLGNLPKHLVTPSMPPDDGDIIEATVVEDTAPVTVVEASVLEAELLKKFASRPNESFDARTIQATSTILKKRYKVAVIGEEMQRLASAGKIAKKGQRYKAL